MKKEIEYFFEEWPESYQLYIPLESYIGSLGDIKIEVMKTQISFGTKRKFTWVWLPQTWISKRPENSLTLTFVLSRKIEDKQIESVVEPRPGMWTHHVVIKNSKDFTAEVKQWLKEAYNQSL